VLRHGVLALLLAATALPAAAQQRRGVVEIDHASGRGRFILTDGDRVDTTAVGRNPTVRVPRGTVVTVRVVGTNTALYRFATEQENVPIPDLESVKSLVIRSAPYMPELRTVAAAIDGRGGGGEDVAEAMAALAETDRRLIADATTSLRAAVGKVDRAVQGRTGIQRLQSSTLYALERMRLGTAPEEAAADLRSLLPRQVACGDDAPVRLSTAQELLAGVFEVSRAHAELADAIAGPGYFDQLAWKSAYDTALVVDSRAMLVLDDYESLVTTAYRLERIVGIVAGACSAQALDSLRLRTGSGRAMTVTVTPRTESELARVAELGATSWTVTVQPRVMISPSLSIGGLAAPQGRFPIYGTSSGGGGTTVVATGRSDARFTAAGMLGVTWGPLDRRETSGIAIWLPELVVGAGSTPTFGVGTAISYGFLRLGVGAAWMRHRALQGMQVGDALADPSELRVSDTYGRPRTYVTLSVFDWSPVAARLR
jgi:hypothetical protein